MLPSTKWQALETRLLKKWALFFDLAEWEWSRADFAIDDWQPDFCVSFDCSHFACSGRHRLFVSVLPVADIDGVKGHPALDHSGSVQDIQGTDLADGGAVFGSTPHCSRWEMVHGRGVGLHEVTDWVDDADRLWRDAECLLNAQSRERMRVSSNRPINSRRVA